MESPELHLNMMAKRSERTKDVLAAEWALIQLAIMRAERDSLYERIKQWQQAFRSELEKGNANAGPR